MLKIGMSCVVLFTIVAAAATGSAQCNPGNGPGGSGPDVIVGEITTPQSYGTAAGYYAYSIGTTSCNIGTAELDWIASTNHHPVIAQNMYRLYEGRFEHIGMSWLKHGFTALQGNTCGCGCVSSGTGSRLGVGCSDPYGASLNGSQGSLGPRSEVIDPANGGFLYPPTLDPPNPDLTFRRLRVPATDLDATLFPGARYFVEAHYVTPDDALAGNAHNNASHREVSVSPSTTNHAITYLTNTQRQLQAIRAWASIDPSVTLIDVLDGEGGLFILGTKVTQIGTTGLYSYEYALYNMNSTRAARSFTLPLPTGVISSDVEFHDVEYHSTEVWDGADWTVNASGGTIAWSTSLSTIDPGANALRWGTLYNLRFTANSPPGPAIANIGLFETGVPGALNVAVQGPTATTLDCNNNGVIDGDEIAAGAPDCDNNGLLDECQVDCDGNGTADSCELIAQTAQDCNGDLIPDGCQIAAGDLVDCDGDGVPDLCQLAFGTATDCDANGEIDICQILAGTLDDCDADLLADLCEIADGSEIDCDGNGFLDSCQIAGGVDLDCDANGILDLCETTGVYAHPVIETPPLPVDTAIAVSTVIVSIPGIIEDIDVAVEIPHVFIGDLEVDLGSPAMTTVRLHDNTGSTADDLIVTYDDDGGPGTITPFQPLSAFDGVSAVGTWTLTVADTFPSADNGSLASWNLFVGIQGAGIPDCNTNGIHDGCEIDASSDCNTNGVLDSCDIASGTSLDANSDGVPDECGPPAQTYVRGDVNADANLDLSDAIGVLQFLFAGVATACEVALDVNGSNVVDLADAIALLEGLFTGGALPVAPFPNCGVDATTTLTCTAFSACP